MSESCKLQNENIAEYAWAKIEKKMSGSWEKLSTHKVFENTEFAFFRNAIMI